jgi:molybdopterin/thiamine biosynthesis adenylyltransferase
VAVIAAYADAGYQKETIARITQQLLASYTQARVDEFQLALEQARDSLIENDDLLSDEWIQVAQLTNDALQPISTLIIPQPPQGNTGTCANLASCN